MTDSIQDKILSFLSKQKDLDDKTININNIDLIAQKLNLETYDLRIVINKLFYNCNPCFEFKVVPTRNDDLNVIQCTYTPVLDDILNKIVNKINVESSDYTYDEIEFLINQFKNKVSNETLINICEFYYMIKSQIDIEKVKYVLLSEDFISRHYSHYSNAINAILDYGYSIKLKNHTLKWKIYNNKTIEVKEDIKAVKGTVDYNTNNNNIIKLMLTMKDLTSDLLKEVGVQENEKDNNLIKEIDLLFKEYEKMEDWEKIKNSNMILNKWKDIKEKYINDRA